MNLRLHILRIASTESWHFDGENFREQEQLKEVLRWASKVASEAEWEFVAGRAKEKVYIGIGFYYSFIISSCCTVLFSFKLNGTLALFLPMIDLCGMLEQLK